MATLLLLENDDVATSAMKGILAHGNHRCILTKSAEEAWTQLEKVVCIDLVIAELKLPGENGLQFLTRLRAHPLMKRIPFVPYTSVSHPDVVKKALSLGVQNYLIKPFNEETVHQEVSRAVSDSWRSPHFEEEDSFCKLKGLTPELLVALREQLREKLEIQAVTLGDRANAHDRNIVRVLASLIEEGEAAGVRCVVEYLQSLLPAIVREHWDVTKRLTPELQYAARLIRMHLHPTESAEEPGKVEELTEEQKLEQQQRQLWFSADLSQGPVVDRATVELQLQSLAAFPVMETVGAAFHMAADAKTTSLTHLIELVNRDPALTAQVLIAANTLAMDQVSTIDDVRVAVGLLGNLRLSALARAMPVIPERHMQAPPITWPHFWTFQMGVARVTQFCCSALELNDIAPLAYSAGLLHDLGKFLLVKLYPHGFAAMVEYARQRQVSLQEAEHGYIGFNAQELGGLFADSHALPAPYASVIRHVNTPDEAGLHRDLAAAVSLARHICLHSHVGYCGDTPKDVAPPLEQTVAWSVLRERVFPAFNLRVFETQARAFCLRLKQELAGRTT